MTKFSHRVNKAVSALAVVAILWTSGVPPLSAATKMWLSGEDPVVQSEKHKRDPADYVDMFRADAPWGSNVEVFAISMQMVLRGTDEQLRKIIEELRRRRIAMAVTVLLLEGAERCGNGVEGYGSHGAPEAVSRRIVSLNGRIDYLMMDEPVWFGHIFESGSHGRVGCRMTLPQLVDQVSSKLSVFRQFFPNVDVVDVEPINAKSGGPQSISAIVEFDRLLRQRDESVPILLMADISWEFPGWGALLEGLAPQLHGLGMRLGVICNGDSSALNSEAWVSQAIERCRNISREPGIHLDDVMITSWDALPTLMLPDTNPGALTYAAKKAETLFR